MGRGAGGPGAARADRAFAAAAVAVVLLAAALRFWGLDQGLPHLLARPDERTIVEHTRGPARGELQLDYSVYPDAYIYLVWAWGEAGLRVAQALGRAPDGDYLEILGRRPAVIYLAQRSLSAVAGTLAVLLVLVFARREIGRAGAVVAGLLVATNLLHVRDSHSLKTDALLSLMTPLVLAAAAPLVRRATSRRGALAGVALGGALATKYAGVTLAVPIYVASVLGSVRRGWRRWLPAPAFAAAGAALLVFAAVSPFLVMSPAFRDMIGWMATQILAPFLQDPSGSVEAVPPLARSPGLAAYPYGEVWWASGWLYHARLSLWHGAGVLPTLLAPVAVLWALRDRERPLCLLAGTFVVAHFAVMGASQTVFFSRYMTPLVPALAIVEAGLLVAAASRRAGHARPLALTGLALALVAQPLAASIAYDRLAAREDTRVLASQWLHRELPRGTRVAVLGTTSYLPYGAPRLPAWVLPVPTRGEPAGAVASRADFVVVHEHPLRFSTPDPEVMRELAPSLRLLAEFDPFTEARERAVFEGADAYYIPVHGFAAIERPGPRIRIYANRRTDPSLAGRRDGGAPRAGSSPGGSPP